LFEEAWKNVATVETAQSGFRETGTLPVNRATIDPNMYELFLVWKLLCSSD